MFRTLLMLALVLAAMSASAAQPPCETNPDAKIQPNVIAVSETTLVQGALVPTDVKLNGNPSKGDRFAWTQTAGPTVDLTAYDVKSPNFLAPAVGPTGATLRFTLTAYGCEGTTPSTATVLVNVANVNSNSKPIASATVPSAVNEGEPVTLDGSASSDPDGDALTYAWIQTGGPAVALANASGAVATFTAPDVGSSGATLSFELTVSDGALTGTTTKNVSVLWVDVQPTAALSCPATVDERVSATLDASASKDPDDGIASYVWGQASGGPVAVPAVQDGARPDLFKFVAPSLTWGLGDTMTFKVKVSDTTGKFDEESCSVQVNDVSKPVLTVPSGPIVAEAGSREGAAVAFTASALDGYDGDVAVTCAPPSGSTFALGATQVTCSAHDKARNTASQSFEVVVQDTTPPTLNLPSDTTAEATSSNGAAVSFASSAHDLVDGAVAPTCTPAPGATFPLGKTTVTCSATDTHGNSASASFTVTVVDTTPPALTVPGQQTVEATGPDGAKVTFSASAEDIVDGAVTPICTPASSSTFALDVAHTVTCAATDAAGNTATASFGVRVVDTTAPTLSLPANVSVLATSLAGAAVSFDARATDLVDGAVTPACTPSSGSTFAPGTTKVSCTATDAHGNASKAATFDVTVRFAISGFFQPIDNLPAVNTVKNGSTVPAKWKVLGQDVEITDVRVVKSASVAPVSCQALSDVENPVELTTTGGTVLRYDSTGKQFILNWQTPKSSGACLRLEIRLVDDQTLSANFKLK